MYVTDTVTLPTEGNVSSEHYNLFWILDLAGRTQSAANWHSKSRTAGSAQPVAASQRANDKGCDISSAAAGTVAAAAAPVATVAVAA